MSTGKHFSLSIFKSRYLWALTGSITAVIYIPLLAYGGIITDDWGDIRQTWDCVGFFQCYKEWFPLFSNRPLAPLPITLTTKIFTTHYFWYLLTNSTIYLVALCLTAKAFAPFLRSFARNLFFLLAVVPCIAMPLIASPINQLTATVAYLYWAISLNFLLQYHKKPHLLTYGMAYFFLLCGFFTYEIILPLLFFTAFIPALLDPQEIRKIWFSYFVKYIFPILVVLLIVIVWQKVLAPQFFEDVSRLRFNYAHAFRNLYTWVSVFVVQLPILFIKATAYLNYMALGLFALIGILFWLGNSSHRKTNLIISGCGFLVISFASLVSSSLIFILTDESAVSWGYQARGLSSTWYALAIFIACLAQIATSFSKSLRILCLVGIYLFTCFSVLSFSIQRNKYIESWNLQLLILEDAISLIEKKVIGPNASILANVPRYAPNNYNRELVFSQSWDFPAALVLYVQDQVRGGIVVDSRGRDLQNLHIEQDTATVNDQGRVDFTNLWLYDFDPIISQGTLTRIQNPKELQKLITGWKK